MRMNELDFHETFDNPKVLAKYVNRSFYDGKSYVKPYMVEDCDEEEFENLCIMFELDTKTTIIHRINISEQKKSLVIIMNTPMGIHANNIKLTMRRKEE